MEKNKFIIEDDFGNHLYNQVFDDSDDAWSYVYNKYPVIYNKDGTQNDQEEELSSHYVVHYNNQNK